MAVHEAVQRMLAGESGNLTDAYVAISNSLSSQVTFRAGLEALVVCAEAAVKGKNITVTQRCLETYFKEVKRYNCSAVASAEIKDQFLIRAHYAAGMLVAEQARALKGQPLIDGTLEAVKHLMQGLELAAMSPRYQFLIYNGSVHLWHASHPLQRDGLRRHLLYSSERTTLALEKVAGHEEWKVRQLIALALIQHESNKADDAAKTLVRAYDTAMAAKLTTLQREVAQLQLHLAADGGGGKPSKAGQAAAAGKKAPNAPHSASGGAASSADAEAALRRIQTVLTAKPDKAVAEAALKEAVAKVDPALNGPGRAANLHVVARAGWAAAVLGLPVLAEAWAGCAAGAQDLSPRVWSDLTRALLALQQLGADEGKLVPSTIKVHVAVLEQLDDVVGAFLRLKDVEGVHDASRLVWNAGLLLLQPELRHHTKRAFNGAAKALEVLASPLGKLRAQLHLEAAKCDMAEDALIKAAQEVAKALALDYVVPEAEQQRAQLQRPLDRYLTPLATSLALRTSLSDEPQGPEEAAVLLVERSRESRNPAIRLDLLNKAFDLLVMLPVLHPPPADTRPSAERAAQQLSCRRRTCIWADLLRSAWRTPDRRAQEGELVLRAAPFCLAPLWQAAADREMVLLQAEVCYLEAEAATAALRALNEEIVPPTDLAGGQPDEDDAGVRLPSSTDEQLQWLVINAITRGMQAGLSIKEPWLVINGGVLAWNTYLPVLQAHRPAELVPVLQPVCDTLLQLDPADSDGALAVALAEALAQATEHAVLLELLRPQPAPTATTPDEVADGEQVLPTPQAVEPLRFGQTEWYQQLPAARVSTGGLPVKACLRAAALVATLVPRVEAVCERALARAGTAQPQSLFQAYTRLKQLRGVPAVVPAGTAAAAEQTSKVVGLIESLGGSPSSAQAVADVMTAKALLSALPSVNVELWAKLARAAAATGAWPAALECAQGAAAVLPAGTEPMDVTRTSDVPRMTPNDWFWLGAAELVHGQAVLSALVRPSGQDMATQLSLRRTALTRFVLAARCAEFVGKADLAEVVARAAWGASAPFLRKPLLRAALAALLGPIASCLNKLRAKDKPFQVHFNCLLLECLCAARQWDEAVAAAEAACRSLRDRHLHRPLLVWKVAALSQSGRNVLSEMNRVKEHPPEVQGHTWTVLGQHSGTRYDQVHAYSQALAAVDKTPWLKSDYLTEYAEWLVSSGVNDGETAEEVLLAAADSLLEFDAGVEEDVLTDAVAGPEVQLTAPHASFKSQPSMRDGSASNPTKKAPAPKRSSGASSMIITKQKKLHQRHTGNAHDMVVDPDAEPSTLTAALLERLMRIFVMLSTAVTGAFDHVDYLLTAHHYALRILTAAITSAVLRARRVAAAEGRPAPSAMLPDTLQGWATFQLAPELMQLLAEDTSSMAINSSNLTNPEESMAYVELLTSSLAQRGFDVHCLSLLQLQRCLAALALKSEGMSQAWALDLVQLLDRLALSEVGSVLEASLGDYTLITPQEEAQALEQRQVAALVDAASSRLVNGRLRSAMAVGRLSFLRKDRASAPPAHHEGTSPQPPGDAEAGTPGLQDTNTTTGGGDLPAWLDELAGQIGAGDSSSAGADTALSNVLLLRPLSLHDAWLKKGDFLVSRGHYAVARDLITHAQSHARHCDHREAEARALLLLSRCEALARQTDASCRSLQAAQMLGGDTSFWRDSIIQYVTTRLDSAHTSTTDVKEALQGGIAMFTTIARDDRAAEKAAMMAGAALKLQLSHLLLVDMASMRQQGVSAWRRWYDQAITLTQQAIASYAAREAGIPHVEALLQQAALMQADPAPAKDSRPRLKKIEKVLTAAEGMASQLHTAARPRDLASSSIVMPVTRLLARCRRALGAAQLALARARDDNATADRSRARPSFPKVKGQDADVILAYIDEMETEAAGKGLEPEDSALMHASSAAQLSPTPADGSAALLLAGECLLFKYLKAVSTERHPWRSEEAVPPPSPSTAMGPNVVRLTGGHACGMSTPTGSDGELGPLAVAPPAPTDTGSSGRDTAREQQAEAMEAQVAAAQAVADGLQARTAATLHEAVVRAASQRCWATAEAASFALLHLHGRNDPQQAAWQLIAAQAYRSALHFEELLLSAAPLQLAEALAATQLRSLAKTLPVATGSSHYQKVSAVVHSVGPVAGRLDVMSRHVPKMLEQLPAEVRLLCLQLAVDGNTLYLGALNIPDTVAAAAAAAAATVGAVTSTTDKKKPASSGASKGEPASPPAPCMCLVGSAPIDADELKQLLVDLKSYHRAAEKSIREGLRVAADAAAAATTAVAAAAAAGTLSALSAGAQDGERTKARALTKKATRKPALSGDLEAAPAPEAPPSGQLVVEPELNTQWQSLLERFASLLEPLLPALLNAVPTVSPVANPAEESPTAKRPSAKGGSVSPAAGTVRHQVVLLLDNALSLLPWEALPVLSESCISISRAPSLHLLHACCCGTNADATAVAAAAPGGLAATEFDLGGATYLVDPRCEASTPAQARASCSPAMAEAFSRGVLPTYGFSMGLLGQALRVPSDAEYQSLLASASGLLFLGVGRFGAYVSPAVVAGLDLRQCDVALVFDRATNEASHTTQMFLDNRKTAAQRLLESPQATAELLLARGVRAVVVAQAAVTPEANLALMTEVLGRLAQSATIGEAVAAANTKVGGGFALAHARSNLQVYGAAHLVAAATGKGKAPKKK